jgi:hypothetical protein
MERARKRIKLEEGKPSFSANECTVIDAPYEPQHGGAYVKEEQISEADESGLEESGSEGTEEYQSYESGGEEESDSGSEVAQGSKHNQSTSEANTVSDPYCSECRKSFQSSAEKERHNSKWHYDCICYACDEGFPSQLEFQKVSLLPQTGRIADLTYLLA